jgi:hypothetical protein
MGGISEGGCVCGAVRYRVLGEPKLPLVCHCRYCQRRLGTAFAAIAFYTDEAIESVEGTLNHYEHRSDESGRSLRARFCPRCGTTVMIKAERLSGMTGISVGTFDEPGRVRIDRHIWMRSKLPWVKVPEDVAAHEQALPRPTPKIE